MADLRCEIYFALFGFIRPPPRPNPQSARLPVPGDLLEYCLFAPLSMLASVIMQIRPLADSRDSLRRYY